MIVFAVTLLVLFFVCIYLEVKRDKPLFQFDRIILFLVAYFIILPGIQSMAFLADHLPMKHQDYSHFEENKDNISEFTVFNDAIIYKIKDDPDEKMKHVTSTNVSVIREQINQQKAKKKFVNISISERNPFYGFLAFVLMLYYILIVTKKAQTNISRTKMKDVVGLSIQKEKSQDIIKSLLNETDSKSVGYLFEGPPGLGKTFLAQAIANESKVFFQNIKSSTLEDKWVGTGSGAIQKIFQTAIKEAPSIIFLDEFDAIGAKRSFDNQSSKYYNQSTNTLLQCMNNIKDFNALSEKKVIVIAATNHKSQLDPAIIRSGRFDVHIKFTYPSLKDRVELLQHYIGDKNTDVDINLIAKKLVGFTPADIENLINKAKNDEKKLTTENLTLKIMDVAVGDKSELNISDKDLERTAIHESGHALVAFLSNKIADPTFVSIQPRGNALGITSNVDDSDFDKVSYSKKELEDQIKMLYAGQLAEELLLDDISSGASNDIERATAIAQRMVYEYGMSPFGMIKLSQSLSSDKAKDYVFEILHNMKKQCKDMLEENKDKLKRLSSALLEKKEMPKKDILNILKE